MLAGQHAAAFLAMAQFLTAAHATNDYEFLAGVQGSLLRSA
jgi:hypothetical protein